MTISSHVPASSRVAALVSSLALLALAGCATHVSRGIDAHGHAEELVFPDRSQVVLDVGTFPRRDAFASVAPGLTRDQLYDLFGRPHFPAGFRAREWDYLFHFRNGDGSVTTCQYKVLFDRERIAREFHWSSVDCAGLVAQEQVQAAPAAPTLLQGDGRAVLEGDALFAFARHGADDLLPGGRALIDRLAGEIVQAGEVDVRVVGHTDPIGSEVDNQRLSERRARTVRDLLVAAGVPADAVMAAGRGEREPVQSCEGATGGDLVECLAPNRRVEVSVRPR